MADSVTLTDNRSGESVEIPIIDGGIASSEFSKLLPGIWFYDPGFSATAECESGITYIDGDAGILEYRGYPIEQLAKDSTFLEVAYLLLNGELPTGGEMTRWVDEITHHTFIHENMRKRFLEGFHYDAHPMGMLVSAVAALSTFYPEAKMIFDADNRHMQIVRLIAKMPTLAAAAYRFSLGQPFVYPDNDLSFPENFLSMMWKIGGPTYRPHPVLARAMEILFILHADHEQNCSTTAMRTVGSSHADPFSACAAACAALYGPRHGGANEAVVRMLTEIGEVDNVEPFVRSVKEGHGRLQGFGHRVYKNYDPRAKIVQKTAYDVFEVTGKNPLLDIASEARRGRARRRLLHLAQALPECRLLFRSHLPGDGLSTRDVHRPVRDPAHGRLARALERDAERGRKDRATASAVHRQPATRLRAERKAHLTLPSTRGELHSRRAVCSKKTNHLSLRRGSG